MARPMPAPGRPRCTRAARAAGLALACAMSARPASSAVLRDNLYDVKAVDGREAWAVGNFGAIYHTADAGTTWQPRDSGTKTPLFGVGFSTPTQGWVVGIDGLVLRTRDGGGTWEVQRGSVEAGSIEELGFLEALKNPGLYGVQVAGRYGVVTGDTGMVLTSTDGGETWVRHELPGKQQLVWLRAVSLGDGPEGFVVGGNGFTARIEQDRVVLPAAVETR